ncbi:hypothetical protein AAHE18_20G118500 [Arachis hypogaea]
MLPGTLEARRHLQGFNRTCNRESRRQQRDDGESEAFSVLDGESEAFSILDGCCGGSTAVTRRRWLDPCESEAFSVLDGCCGGSTAVARRRWLNGGGSTAVARPV